MLFRQLIDYSTNTFTYLLADENSKEALLIDPVLEQVERDFELIQQLGLKLIYCLETHVHADHITGTAKLKELSNCVGLVPENAKVACADRELKDGEILALGNIQIRTIATLGHTDSHNAYLANNKFLFTGDSLFIRGCGRTDFQSGSAEEMYNSVTQKLFSLPPTTIVYPGHDYKGHLCSTIEEEISFNPRFLNLSKNQFIDLMSNLNLPNPKKIMEAVPANQKCGKV
jgi:sulfur dioxygenase